MLDSIFSLGILTRDSDLAVANLRGDEGAPGVVLLPGAGAVVVWVFARFRFSHRTSAVRRFRKETGDLSNGSLVHGREKIEHWLGEQAGSTADRSLFDVWDEFVETLRAGDRHGPPMLRNSVRPATFLHVEGLHFGVGFYQIVPGRFVSLGLALTFLGLIAALQQISGDKIDDAAMADLLQIASATFIMSQAGLVCSIALTSALRNMRGW